MGRKRRRDVEKERFWRGIIDGHAGSGLSIREYCGRRGVSEPSFFAWRCELARGDAQSARQSKSTQKLARARAARDSRTQPRFAQLQIASAELQNGAAVIEIVLPDGVCVRVHHGVSRQTLGEVLAALEPRPC